MRPRLAGRPEDQATLSPCRLLCLMLTVTRHQLMNHGYPMQGKSARERKKKMRCFPFIVALPGIGWDGSRQAASFKARVSRSRCKCPIHISWKRCLSCQLPLEFEVEINLAQVRKTLAPVLAPLTLSAGRQVSWMLMVRPIHCCVRRDIPLVCKVSEQECQLLLVLRWPSSGKLQRYRSHSTNESLAEDIEDFLNRDIRTTPIRGNEAIANTESFEITGDDNTPVSTEVSTAIKDLS